MLVGGVRNSSCAGQSMTYVFISEAYISYGGGWEGLGVSKELLFIMVYISNIFLLIFYNFYMCFTSVLVHVSVFLCLLEQHERGPIRLVLLVIIGWLVTQFSQKWK